MKGMIAIQLKPLLTLEEVSFSYHDSDFALKDITLSVSEGERIAVVGNNGAGKSTFFLLCNGVLSPDHGRISFMGGELTNKKKDLMRLRKEVGIVFQDPDRQIIGPTVETEVSFGPMNLKLEKEEATKRVEQALESMNLLALRTRPPHHLSGGQRKRVTIADVLAMESKILLIDEPTASLDNTSAQALESVLAQLGEGGRSLLVSTHDMDFVWRWAERVLVFHAGKLLADDTPVRIFSDSQLVVKAGLKSPVLCDIAKLLGVSERGIWPKTIEQLKKQL